jgi:mRNA interferase MazF
MPPTTSFDFGDIILVPFPFTDQSTIKKRPAVVVSSVAYHRERPDLIVMAITSQARPSPSVGEMMVTEWQFARLLKPSVIKPLLATIERSIVLRRLGKLHPDDVVALRRVLGDILG